VRVLALTAEGFRNLGPLALSPHPRFNVLSGDNGQGKTNLLEAIYVLATLRSFRTTRLDELVRFGGEVAALRARVEHRQSERVFGVDIGLRPPRKQALCDGKSARTGEYFGGFNLILFAPEDLRLPKGPPAGRRRFLDRAIWNTCPSYLDEVRVYERILRSRNILLRGGPGRSQAAAEDGESAPSPMPGAGALPDSGALLEIYDQRLSAAGAVLFSRRRRYVQALAPRVAEVFARISGSEHEVQVQYQPALKPAKAASKEPVDPETGSPTPGIVAPVVDEVRDLGERLYTQLQRDRRRDQLRGFTHSGPHADDLLFFLDGRPAELHASQGQTRALVLSLKIAEIQHLHALLGDPPVLLLDDVSSELDRDKNAALFAFLRESPSQVFITTTDPSYIRIGPAQADRQDFAVRTGGIVPVESATSGE
jgi:DNA replication and repair protein RecF